MRVTLIISPGEKDKRQVIPPGRQALDRGREQARCDDSDKTDVDLRYTRGLGWRMHCGAEVTESSTNKQHHHQ